MALTILSTLHRFTGRTSYRLSAPRVHFLYLHGVDPGQEDRFRWLLTQLSKGHRFISYSDAVQRVRTGDVDAPYICFSFDDGYATCLTAASILEEYEATACMFICPGLMGMTRGDLERRFPSGTFPSGCGGAEARIMTWLEVESLRCSGHEVGSHTMTHPVLAALPDRLARSEIVSARDAIAERMGSVAHFAWPRGRFRYFSARDARTAREAGYLSCASAERGSHKSRDGFADYPCIRRDHVDLSWPTSHILYLLGRSAKNSSSGTVEWPREWRVETS